MRDQLREYFYRSLNSFLANSWQSIRRSVSEVNLCGALGMEMCDLRHQYLSEDYRVDIEYDKMQNGRNKQIIDRDGRIHDIRCDLIVHSAGRNVWKDNLIAIEMKKSYRRNSEKQSDRERLRAMTNPSYDGAWLPNGIHLPHYICDYEIGFFIELNPKMRIYKVEEFQDGGEVFGAAPWRRLPYAEENF